MATHGNLAEGLVVKGVDLAAERRVTTVARDIRPELDSIPGAAASGRPGVVLGTELAERLRAGLGDKVVLASFEGGARTAVGLVPKLGTFQVVGLFHSGLYEYDANPRLRLDALGRGVLRRRAHGDRHRAPRRGSVPRRRGARAGAQAPGRLSRIAPPTGWR